MQSGSSDSRPSDTDLEPDYKNPYNFSEFCKVYYYDVKIANLAHLYGQKNPRDVTPEEYRANKQASYGQLKETYFKAVEHVFKRRGFVAAALIGTVPVTIAGLYVATLAGAVATGLISPSSISGSEGYRGSPLVSAVVNYGLPLLASICGAFYYEHYSNSAPYIAAQLDPEGYPNPNAPGIKSVYRYAQKLLRPKIL